MYDAACSSPLPSRPPFESDDISLFLHHLLNSSSSSSSSSPSSSLVKPPNHSLPSPSPLQPPSLFSSGPQYDHNRISQSARVLDSHNRLTSGSTDESSGFILPTTTDMKGTGIFSNAEAVDCEAVTASVKRRKLPLENDFDDFDCESEEGLEGSEGQTKSAPSRSSSKRSRAAEVHNLSEKRRRSRINEKMKALQNLIPNSNKTDKASMLDEAIEYLKQLQLQVQMLSMRNGFSLHPMYLPGVVQLPQVRMGFNEGNGLPPHISIGRETLTVNPETSTQNSFGISNQCTTSNQPMVMPTDASYGLDTSLHGHQGSFHLPATSEEIYREQMLRQQQFYLSQSSRASSGDNQMKTMATTSLPFDAHTSALDHTNCAEASVLQRERSQDVLPDDVDNGQTFIKHLHGLQTSDRLPNDNPAR